MSTEKTEKPSEQKLKDARKKGQFARSRLFSASVVTLAGTIGFPLAGAPSKLKAWAAELLALPAVAPGAAVSQAVTLLLAMTAPVLLAALLGSLAVSVATAGLHLNAGHVMPKLERVDPFKGLKRLFALDQLLELLKGLLVAGVIAALVWRGAREAGPAVLQGVARSGELAMLVGFSALEPVLRRAAVVLVLLGAADYALARRKHARELMMSREDLKREHKSTEGDPHHKAKRKQLHQQISAGGPARGVHKATAVVVNPTQIAVALRYDELECDAPYLVAKGREEDALKIRKEAAALEIPIVRDVPLARALVGYDVGEEVPEELYQAAAAILKVAMERKAAKQSPLEEGGG
jgi:type III secretion protein U